MGRKKIECLSEQDAVDGERVMILMVENGSRDFCGRRFALARSQRGLRFQQVVSIDRPSPRHLSFCFWSHVPLTTAEIFLFYIMYPTSVV